MHDHGGEFVNRDVAAVIKAYNVIDIKTRPRHPESNGTVRQDSADEYGKNYLQVEAIIAKLIRHYNDQRLHVTLGCMAPATWHRVRIPRHGEQHFHGMVNTDSTAT